jgi:hypothetical protein
MEGALLDGAHAKDDYRLVSVRSRALPNSPRNELPCEWQTRGDGCAARYAVVVGDPRRIEAHRHKIWLRRRSVRRMYGPYRWQTRIRVSDPERLQLHYPIEKVQRFPAIPTTFERAPQARC